MLDQPLPAGPITQERKVSIKKKNSNPECLLVIFETQTASIIIPCIIFSPLQHGPSDEVTSEEEEEEEMGEVPIYIYSWQLSTFNIFIA